MTDRTMRQYYSMHAECHAILRAKAARKNLRGATIYVATISSKSGAITSAKPCQACAALIRSVGIKHVVYTERKEVK